MMQPGLVWAHVFDLDQRRAWLTLNRAKYVVLIDEPDQAPAMPDIPAA
jgi:hypothetical protein